MIETPEGPVPHLPASKNEEQALFNLRVIKEAELLKASEEK